MKNVFSEILVALIVAYGSSQGTTNIHNSGSSVYDDITRITRSTFGSDYRVEGYEIMDSVLSRGVARDFNYDPYTDPYGTLRHAVIFYVRKERPASFYTDENSNDTTILCIEKNGRLTWHSGSEITGDVESLLCCYDLNNSGTVDIGLIVHEFQKTNFSLLYIVSWDGRMGEFISEIDQSNRSVIISESDLFDIFDVDGDGIYKIRGCWAEEGDPGGGWFPANNPSPTAPYVTYSWNGIKYGYWPNATQVPGYAFLPENRIKLSAQCKVKTENGRFRYSYVFRSDAASKQLIDNIFIASIDSMSTTAFGPWTGNYSWVLNSYRWTALDLNRSTMLRAGEEIGGFGFLSDYLPTIKNVYVQGFAPLGDVASEERTDDAIVNNVSSNSYVTYTLGPGNPKAESGSAFLDTLISYKDQCVALGWLTNRPAHEKDESDDRSEGGIVERLDRRLEKAKDALTRGDSVKARLELSLFVKEVEQLHGKEDKGERSKEKGKEVLTSEGYALLKYNAEYLVDRLSERYGRGDEREHRGKK